MSKGALAGLKVLDLSRVLAGPWATQILGDLGADVIKVERPVRGDDTRGWGPPEMEAGGDVFSAYYLACNRNKRSLALDLSSEDGAAVVRRLAASADVLVENFKVGTLARYGLDYQALRTLNPGLVYCSITGFGQTGPYAGRGGYDFLAQGMGGLMSVTGPVPDSPTKVGVPVADIFTGLYAVVAIQAALRYRDLTGRGQHIDCALLDTVVGILANQAMNWFVGGAVPSPMGNAHPNVVPYRTFAARDGQLIVAVGSDTQFRGLCQVLGRPELAEHPDYSSNSCRVVNRVRLETLLEELISAHARAWLLARMEDLGVPGGPINTVDAVFQDPQVAARQMVEVLQVAGCGIAQLRFPALLSESPAAMRLPPPALGADGVTILKELGLADADIARLSRAGILYAPDRAGIVSSQGERNGQA
ncbi:CaiB/BaiF CoA transferase family protein [Castellaniella defragrans]|uniref:CaiB/BaiF CoA transferase family protein n=1 Tax=Castellaniella defragrans TaxID=75697 RepID=UPI0023F55968|nr:CaiB/BaiF CoA-transferase family protein [Castellaniella defragrans]